MCPPKKSAVWQVEEDLKTEALDNPALETVAWWDPEQLAAALEGPEERGGKGAIAVPALLFIVRGQLMFCVTFDLHNGLLVLHNGSFTVPGLSPSLVHTSTPTLEQ